MNDLPRLPMLPVAGGGYEPPEAEASPARAADAAQEARQDQEFKATTIALPANGVGAPGTPQEVSVYKTIAPWCAVDVYITPNPPTGGYSTAGCISVFIYAVTKGMRTLVASGRYAVGAGATPLPFAPRWVAGVRSVAASYEVTVHFTQFGGAPVVVGAVDVSIAASNEAVDAPTDIGAELAGQCFLSSGGGGSGGIGVNIAGVQIPPHLEVLTVRGVNGAAAARYLMLFDSNAVVPANGDAPLMSWPLGDLAGEGLGGQRIGYRAKLRPQLVVSSTPLTLTLAADCFISADLR